MVIKKLILNNFQGIKHFEFMPDGKNTSVYADNGCGKTTLYNAFTWLLYGKPSTNEVKFTPQTFGTHNLEHSAEMEIVTDDGYKKTLKKVYHEVYKTQRGSAESLFSGYTTDFFIDDVPVREKDYQATMASIYKDDETAKLLTRYNYFLEDMKIKDRRALLLDVCGNISDEDVIAANEQLKPLPEILNGKSIEDFTKIVTAERKKINDELKLIPARIDEAEKSKPEVVADDAESMRKALEDIKAEKAEIEAKIATVDFTSEAEIRKQIAELEAAKAEARAEYTKAETERERNYHKKAQEKETERIRLKLDYSTLEDRISAKQSMLISHTAERERYLADYQAAEATEWDGDMVCPTCGQPLPDDQIEESKKRFHFNKANNLERIREAAQRVSVGVLEREQAEIDGLKEELANMANVLKQIDEELEESHKADSFESIPFEETEEAKRMTQAMNELAAKVEDNRQARESIRDKYHDDILKLDKEINTLQESLAAVDMVKKQDQRIKELATREKELASEYEDIDRKIYLCELFTRKKAEMLTGKINGCFKTLRFRLFQEQINGGIADDCEAIISCGGADVPYKAANNAARINAGLEVIDVLSEHFGVYIPVWVDNAESSTHIIPTNAQQIRLYVSATDKELRVD